MKAIFNSYDYAVELLQKDYIRNQNDLANNGTHHLFRIPFFVLLAFTIELGIKSLYYRENSEDWPSETGHNLKKGYDKLSQHLKDKIREETCKPPYVGFAIPEDFFEETLTTCANTFQNVRYFFENGLKNPVYYSFLYRLKEVVKSEVNN